MITNSDSTGDSQFEEFLAKYMAASERSDEKEINQLLSSNPAFASRVKTVDQFDSSLREMLVLKTEEENSNHQESFLFSNKPVQSRDHSPSFPRSFGNFELADVVGEGGMGIVYRARQRNLGGREVALKVSQFVEENWPGKTARSMRFQTEVEVAGKLDHPNIVPFYESGHVEGRHYIAMKLIVGANFQSLALASQSNEVDRMIKIADAVQHAHDRGILHRDLKPSNIIIDTGGTPFVSDFGLAKLLENSSTVTRTGASIGTPRYMSPEQAEGSQSLTVATDIYALGAILFERICGQPLYNSESVDATLNKVRFGARPNVRAIDGKCDRDLRAIILKCLELEPSDRYESCRAFAFDLEKWSRGEPLETRSVSGWKRGIRWVWHHPRITLAVTAILIAAISFVIVLNASAQNHMRFRITEYARNVQIARTELSEQYPGWKKRAFLSLDVAKSFSSRSDVDGERELASLRANCDIEFDIGDPLFSVPQSNSIAIKFHPTKTQLFIARKYAEDGELACPILVVDTETGKLSQTLKVLDKDREKRCSIRDIAVIPRIEALAVLTTTSNLFVYSIASESFGDLIASREFAIRGWRLQEFIEDDCLLLSGMDQNGTWQINSIDLSNWEILRKVELANGLVSMAKDANSKRLITCEPRELNFRNPKWLQPIWAPIAIERAGSVAHSGDQVAVVDSRGINLFSIKYPSKTFQLESFPSAFSYGEAERNAIRFSPSGNLLSVSDNERHKVRIWNAFDRSLLQSIYLSDSMYRDIAIDFSFDGLLAIFAGNETVVYSVKQPSVHSFAYAPGQIAQFLTTSDRSEIYTLSLQTYDNSRADVTLYSIDDYRATTRASTVLDRVVANRTLHLVLSPDEDLLATILYPDFQSSTIQVFNAKTFEIIGKTTAINGLKKLKFDQKGRLFATIKGGLASLTPDFTRIERQWIRPQVEGALVGSANYHVLEHIRDDLYCIGDEDGWLSIIEWTENPEAKTILKLGSAPLWTSTAQSSKNLVAVGDGDGVIHVVNTIECRKLFELKNAHASRISNLIWTDSGHLLSVGLDNSLKVWSYDEKNQSLNLLINLQLRNNVRQLAAVKSTRTTEELILLRDGANALERLTIRLPDN